jgi:hypothetical protein
MAQSHASAAVEKLAAASEMPTTVAIVVAEEMRGNVEVRIVHCMAFSVDLNSKVRAAEQCRVA